MKPDKINVSGKVCGWVYNADTKNINRRTKCGKLKYQAVMRMLKEKVEKRIEKLVVHMSNNENIDNRTPKKKRIRTRIFSL